MKASELMIGDWVYDKVLKSNARVEALQPLTIKCDIHTHKHLCGEFEPVKLTPEILEKNGFEKVNTQRYDWGVPDDWYVNINPKKKIIHINGANGSNVNLYYGVIGFYVHELQHALRICGLNELADNFKIN